MDEIFRVVQSLDLIVIYCPVVFPSHICVWRIHLLIALFPFTDYSSFQSFGAGGTEDREEVVHQNYGTSPSFCVSNVYFHTLLPFLEIKMGEGVVKRVWIRL